MVLFTANLVIILLGIFHVGVYLLVCKRKQKSAALFSALTHFLNGFIPYAVYESFYGSITGKSIIADHLQVILIVAGLSMLWLYYHVMKKLIGGEE